MAFRSPLPLALLLLVACPAYDKSAADTSSPPQADTSDDIIDDTGSDGELTSARDLCEAVFALCDDAWGWDDADSCADSWLGQGQDWECADIPAYLGCAAPCTQATDCDGFGACEVPCWDAHCL